MFLLGWFRFNLLTNFLNFVAVFFPSQFVWNNCFFKLSILWSAASYTFKSFSSVYNQNHSFKHFVFAYFSETPLVGVCSTNEIVCNVYSLPVVCSTTVPTSYFTYESHWCTISLNYNKFNIIKLKKKKIKGIIYKLLLKIVLKLQFGFIGYWFTLLFPFCFVLFFIMFVFIIDSVLLFFSFSFFSFSFTFFLST